MPKNPLFNVLQGNTQYGAQNGILGQLQRFRSQLKGDPRAQIQQMLNSGQITQEQYNNAVQKANAIMRMLGGN